MTFDHVLVDLGRQVWGGEGAGDGDGDYGGWWWVLNVGDRGTLELECWEVVIGRCARVGRFGGRT